MIKEALLDVTPSNKILFRINEEAQGYQHVLIENGIVVIQCKAERFWTNVNDISNVKMETIIPSSGTLASLTLKCRKMIASVNIGLTVLDLPLVTKKNIRDHQNKLSEFLKRIERATEKVFQFHANYGEVLEKVTPSHTHAKERLGEILLSNYMQDITELYVVNDFLWIFTENSSSTMKILFFFSLKRLEVVSKRKRIEFSWYLMNEGA